MLDEPLGSLDRRLRESLVDELRSLFDALDLSVLFVTHDHDEALALGDRVAVMAAGRVEQVDTPEALWNRPATAFTARFLGWNVLHDTARRGTVAIRPDGLRITADGELAGVVEQRTFRRDHFLVRVALDGTSERLDVVVRDRVVPAIGEAVCLRVDAERRVELPRPAPNRPAPNLHTFDR
jgi:thiamine transport system ATP-binding protein